MAITCREAIEESFANESHVLTTNEVISRVYGKHPDRPWKQGSITAHLIGLSVNHQSSHHYPTLRRRAFLFSLGNGRYRKWNPSTDGVWEVARNGVQLSDSSEEAERAEQIEELETAAAETSLSLERDLERSLLLDLAQLEPGLRLYHDNHVSGYQMDAGLVGRIDILAVDQQNDLVVLELKAGKADDRVCGQILRYMGWVRENLAVGRNVRGIIVANDFTDALEYAAKAMPAVALKKYEVRFKFTDI